MSAPTEPAGPVGLVVVSHSRALAEAAVALAREMAPGEQAIEVAAGLDDGGFGTDALAIAAAIGLADRAGGVVVLMDLGSAVLSAELALDLLEDAELRERVLLCPAPLVEGLVVAAVVAAGGASRAEVAAEAGGALAAKHSQLAPSAGDAAAASDAASASATSPEPGGDAVRGGQVRGHQVPGGQVQGGQVQGDQVRGAFTVVDPHGLHARPAARLVALVRTLAGADVRLRNAVTGSAWVPAGSLAAVATLGALRGHRVEVAVSGPAAQAGLAAVLHLVGGIAPDRNDPEPGGPPPGFGGAEPGGPPPGFGGAEAGGPPPGVGGAGPGGSAVGVGGAEAGGSALGVGGAGPGGPPLRAGGMDPGGPSSDSGGAEPVAVSPGIAVGPKWSPVSGPVPVPDAPAADPATERARLTTALATARDRIGSARGAAAAELGDGEAAIFDAHLLLLDDPALLDATGAAIDAGVSAARAWADTVADTAAAFAALPDPYLAGRAADVRAVGDQVLRALTGAPDEPDRVPPGSVLVAPDLTPAQAAGLDPRAVAGVVLAGGSATAHSAILLRARAVPAVFGAGPGVLAAPDGTVLALDGGTGDLVLDAPPDVAADFHARAATLAERDRVARQRAAEPAVTRDGMAVLVGANVGSAADAAVAEGADLVGLLRTEFLFLDRAAAPDVDEQEAAYRGVAAAMGGRRITLRTLDAGGDKPLPYLALPTEANPFLGLRGIRLAQRWPDLLADQLLAAVRVAHDVPVGVMFPMVATLDELLDARRVLDAAIAREGRGTPAGLQVGIMVEVPAAALKAAAFVRHVDFLSIGTNDLVQYALAAERGNPAVARLADPVDPGVLQLVDAVCRAAGERVLVAVCGEAAADPLAAELLVGLGVRELSVAPPAVPATKERVRELDAGRARARSEAALTAGRAEAVRRPADH